ncbi:CarD family transcriptional regulator [Terrihabitans soli]|nr:CarD family transcriptional regulator [Terrihabitans soli]
MPAKKPVKKAAKAKSGKSASEVKANKAKAKAKVASKAATKTAKTAKSKSAKPKAPAKAKAPKAVAKPAKAAAKPVSGKAAAPAVKPAAKPAVQAKPVASPKAAAPVVKPATVEAKPVVQAKPAAPALAQPKPVIKPASVAPAKPAAEARPADGVRNNIMSDAAKKTTTKQHGFKTNEHIVYPAHGVGQIVAIEEQEIAGYKLELFVITFAKDKMTLRVPISKIASVGMRKLSAGDVMTRALDTLKGRARVKRTMWSRRAQEYEAKINSGDLVAIAEVVRDLHRAETQPEQSYSERQLYEAALDRMARELAAVEKLTDSEAIKKIEAMLAKGPKRGPAKAEDAEGEADAEAEPEAEAEATDGDEAEAA